MKILVAYDGTLQSKEALISGMNRVRKTGGEVVAMQVFDTRLFIDYDAGPAVAQMARQEAERHLADARAIIRTHGGGVQASIVTTDGDPEEAIVSYAREQQVDTLLCPARFRSIISAGRKASARQEEPFPNCQYQASRLS
jgi:nucleotide-binding universal stress UspA family protein